MNRNKQIDGLRGITILLIVSYHIFCRYHEIFGVGSGFPIRWFATFGNITFLLISSYFLINPKNGKLKLLDYYFHKIIRLWPCYAASITITWIVLHIYELPYRMTTITDYLLNVIFLNGFIGIPYVDGAHWYITTLLSAIFMSGMIQFFGIQDKPVTYLCLLVLEGLFKVLGLPLGKLLCESYVGVVCLGMCIRQMDTCGYDGKQLFSAGKGLRAYLKANAWFFMAIICMAYHSARRGPLSFFYLIGALLVFLLAKEQKIKMLESPFLQFVGKISYPLYLIHQNIAYEIMYVLTVVVGYYSVIWGLVAFISTLFLGIALYYCVERPFYGRIAQIKLNSV